MAARRAPRLSWCVLLLLAAAVCPAQEAEYHLRGEQLPVTRVSNGYVQTVTVLGDNEVIVSVATTQGPIGAVGTYGALEPRPSFTAEVPPGFTLPEELRERLRADLGVWTAATEVLEWVMQHVELDVHRSEPQDARSVLRRGRGRCSGLANATVALLLAAGFDARTVSGLLVGDKDRVPHRWVECYLPGAGWVPTDPTLGLWVITPRHLAFADTVSNAPEVEVSQPIQVQLSQLPTRNGRLFRPNHGIELVCRYLPKETEPAENIEDAESGLVAILNGPGGQVFRSALGPEGVFTGLLPGRWLLVIERDGRAIKSRHLELKAGQTDRYTIALTL